MRSQGIIVLSMACNLTLAVWMAVCMVHFFNIGVRGNMTGKGVKCFRYFTIDSNLLVSVAALCMLIAEIAALAAGKPLPEWVRVLKFSGTAAVTVTLLTVLFFLGPTQGFRRMLTHDNLYMHLIGPLIAILSFCFLECGAPLPAWSLIFAVLPTVIYGFVYLALVIGTKTWEDFYGFNAGGRWPLSLTAMILASFVLAVLLRLLHNMP